jgi:hypothetical protein
MCLIPLTKGVTMPLFMERHDLRGLSTARVAELLAAEDEALRRHGAIGHKHWINEEARAVHCLITAPDEDVLLAVQAETGFAAELPTELFAPIERWLGYETIDDQRPRARTKVPAPRET